MRFDNLTITPGFSIVFHIPAQLKDIRLPGYSVRVLFDYLEPTEAVSCQLDFALVKATSMQFSVMEKAHYKRVNDKHVLPHRKYFTC